MSAAEVDAGAAPAWRKWAAGAWAVALYEVRRLQRGRHAWGRLVLILTPVVVATLITLIRAAVADRAFVDPLVVHGEIRPAAADLVGLAQVFRVVDLPFVIFFTAVSLFGNLYNAEIADRTLHHLFLMPVRREVVTAGKYLAAAVTLMIATLAAWLLTCAVVLSIHGVGAATSLLFSAEGLRHALAYATMVCLATLSYGSLFLLLGALVKSPSLPSFAFWGWEWLTLFLPTSFKRFTVIHWLSAFLPATVVPDWAVAALGDPENRVVALVVLLLFSAACLALATWRARHIQVSYGASE